MYARESNKVHAASQQYVLNDVRIDTNATWGLEHLRIGVLRDNRSTQQGYFDPGEIGRKIESCNKPRAAIVRSINGICKGFYRITARKDRLHYLELWVESWARSCMKSYRSVQVLLFHIVNLHSRPGSGTCEPIGQVMRATVLDDERPYEYFS